ncbi:MAG: hypothetical protein AAGE96_02005 [Cyanobacteria bacterium P01_G01_bin.19]
MSIKNAMFYLNNIFVSKVTFKLLENWVKYACFEIGDQGKY